MADYGDSGLIQVSFHGLSDVGSSVVMENFDVCGTRARSLPPNSFDDWVQTISDIVVGVDGCPAFHAIDVNHACCFEEDGVHGFRLKTVPAGHGCWSLALADPSPVG